MEKKDEPSRDRVSDLLARFGLPDELVIAVYQYGSRVCGTDTAQSDWDFTIVVDDAFDPKATDMINGRCMLVDNIDVNLHHKAHFLELIRQHDMRALTCIWLPPKHVWRETIHFADFFTLDLETLRNPVSTISSKAFGYANICFREGRNRKALKNMVHSIRYLLYGIQIATYGRIFDFAAANEYHNRIKTEAERITGRPAMDEDQDDQPEQTSQQWEDLRLEYRRIAKEVHEQFDRLLPPKIKVPRAPRRGRKQKQRQARQQQDTTNPSTSTTSPESRE